MKIFITGITGFIGSYLAESLLHDGHEIAGLLRQTNRLNYPCVKRLEGKVEFHYGSLTDYQSVAKALRDFRPDAIAHLGAITPVAYSFDHPHEVTETNYIGTVNMVEAALKYLPNLKKFIFASSMETYGFQTKRMPFVETDELHPACPYAVAKVGGEKYIQYTHYAYDFPGVIFRQTNAYGRRENNYFIVEAILTQMLKNRNEINLGAKEPVRNFIFITDLISLYKTALSFGSSINGHVFNTGPANGITIENLVRKCADTLKWGGKINWNTRPRRPGEIFYLNSSPAKALIMMNWSPKVSLSDGLVYTANIWMENLGL